MTKRGVRASELGEIIAFPMAKIEGLSHEQIFLLQLHTRDLIKQVVGVTGAVRLPIQLR